MAVISRKDTMPLDDMEIRKSHVDDILAGVEEEQIGVMGNIPLPGSTPTRSKTQVKVSDSSAEALSKTETKDSESTDNEPEFKVEIPDLSNLTVGEDLEVELDASFEEPEFDDIEAMSPMDDEPDIEDEPIVAENEDVDIGKASSTFSSYSNFDNCETRNESSSQNETYSQPKSDFSNIHEAAGPTFVFNDDDENSHTDETNNEDIRGEDNQEDDDTVESVIYEEDDEEFDGNKIKDAYKSQKPRLSTKAQQIIGFLVVILLFLLIFGVSKLFDLLGRNNSNANTEQYRTDYEQPATESDVWFLEKNNPVEQVENTQSQQELESFTFSPLNTESVTQPTEQATEQATTQTSSDSPSVGEIFGLADTRFKTLDDLTQYLTTAIATIATKTNEVITKYNNGEISRNEYKATLDTYYQAIVELAQLLVANKQVYTEEGQSETYSTLESQIRELAGVVEESLVSMQ